MFFTQRFLSNELKTSNVWTHQRSRVGLAAGITAAIAASILASAPAQAANSSSGSNAASKEAASVTNEKVPAGLVNLPIASRYYSNHAFVVDKKNRTLAVWQQTGTGLKQVASFPADLGKSDGDKRFAGDHKTPEGIYFLLDQLEGKQIDYKLYGKRAFTTDYPNYFDKREGKTGWGIWLHAVPDETPLTRGSRGCVVVRNDVILDLTQYIRLGRTPILIQNSTELVSASDATKATNDMISWLDGWRTAWETKNMDQYISAYGDDFHSMNMNREQWKKYKTRLTEQYKSIQVRLSKPAIFGDRDRIIVRFLQEYTSDQHADFGEKVLFVKKDEKGYRIVGEQWTAETSAIAREEIEATTNAIGAAGATQSGASSGASGVQRAAATATAN